MKNICELLLLSIIFTISTLTVANERILLSEKVNNSTILPTGWERVAFNVQTTDSAERILLTPLLAPFSTQTVNSENGNHYLTLSTSGDAKSEMDANATSTPQPNFYGGIIFRNIALPEPYITRKIQITFNYRGIVADNISTGLNCLSVQAIGATGDYQSALLYELDNQWHSKTITITCSPQSQSLMLIFKNYGYTTIDIDNIVVSDMTPLAIFNEMVKLPDSNSELPTGWECVAFNVQTTDSAERTLLTPLLAPFSTQTVNSENGNHYLTLSTSGDAKSEMDANATSTPQPNFYGGIIFRNIALPEPYITRKIQITFNYRGIVADNISTGLNCLSVQAIGATGDYQSALLYELDNQWHTRTITITCSPQSQSLMLIFKNYGYTTIDIDNIVVGEVEPSIALDFGGLSVDFLKKRTILQEGVELLTETMDNIDNATNLPIDWHSLAFNVQMDSGAERDTLTSLLAPYSHKSVNNDNGNNYLTLSTAADAYQILIDQTTLTPLPNFYNGVYRDIAISAPYSARKIKISFKYRGTVASGITSGLNSCLIQVIGEDIDNKSMFFSYLNNQWQTGEVISKCSAQATTMRLFIQNYGCTTIDIDDIKVEAIDLEPLSIYLTPQFFTDNLFCISQNDPAILKFCLQNETGAPVDDPIIVLEMPPGISIIDTRLQLVLKSSETLTNGYTRYKYNIGSLKDNIYNDQLNHYSACFFMIQSSLNAGATVYPVKYWVEDGSFSSAVSEFNIKIIESLKAEQPNKFISGAIISREFDFTSSTAIQSLIDFYTNKGFNTIHIGGAPDALMNKIVNAGLICYTQPWWLVNGYRVGDMNTSEKPTSVQFQLEDGNYHDDIRSTCPVAIYKPGIFFEDHVVAPLQKLLVIDKTANTIVSNWEPYMYDSKGCFCSQCKSEFITYAIGQLSEDQINSDWPEQIIAKHKAIWVKFRSWQHGMIVKQLETTINNLGENMHFIPEVNTFFFSQEGRSICEQYDPFEYIDNLKIIALWGPYLANYKYPGLYSYYTGEHRIMDIVTGQAKKYIKNNSTTNSSPKLLGLVHSSQSTWGMAEPEGIAFNIQTMFVNGWQGALAYYFPSGFDARYWNAIAKSNQAIKTFENYVISGNTETEHTVETLTPLPKLSSLIPEIKKYNIDSNLPLVFSHEFLLNGKRLFAIGNSWVYGDVFVKLSIDNLPANDSFVLHEPLLSRYYINQAGQSTLTSEELSQGIILHVGALQFAYFVLEPLQADKNYGQAVLPADMAANMTIHRYKINQALEFEKKYQDDI